MKKLLTTIFILVSVVSCGTAEDALKAELAAKASPSPTPTAKPAAAASADPTPATTAAAAAVVTPVPSTTPAATVIPSASATPSLTPAPLASPPTNFTAANCVPRPYADALTSGFIQGKGTWSDYTTGMTWSGATGIQIGYKAGTRAEIGAWIAEGNSVGTASDNALIWTADDDSATGKGWTINSYTGATQLVDKSTLLTFGLVYLPDVSYWTNYVTQHWAKYATECSQ